MVGRTNGPCSDTFQPKIFRLKFRKNKTIYRHNIYKLVKTRQLMKMLRKYATNGNMSKNVLFIILRRTFKTRFFHDL
jgi:hypothetical protein